MPRYLVFCIYFDASYSGVPGTWYIICCPKWEEALEFTYRVLGEVLVLYGLLVVRFRTAVVCEPDKMYLVCSHHTTVGYNVCACHSPIYHYTTATAVYLVQRVITACVVVTWLQNLYLSRMNINSQRGWWVCWKSSNTRGKSGLIWNTYTRYVSCLRLQDVFGVCLSY